MYLFDEDRTLLAPLARMELLQEEHEQRVEDCIHVVWNSVRSGTPSKFSFGPAYDLIANAKGGEPEFITTLVQFIAAHRRDADHESMLIAVGTLAVALVTQAVEQQAEEDAEAMQ